MDVTAMEYTVLTFHFRTETPYSRVLVHMMNHTTDARILEVFNHII